MCWWVQYKSYIRSKDDCRNLSALIFQHYRYITKETLSSYTIDDEKTQLPHHIPHDERCLLVAVIASIVKEHPSEEFDECIAFAEKLKKHEVDKKDYNESEILYDSIVSLICSVGKIKIADLDVNIAKHMRIYAAVINVAIRAYIETGPTGSFGMQYLFKQIK